MVIVAKLSGEDEVRGIAEWLKHRAEAFASALGLKRPSTPHATTISRVLAGAFEVDELAQVVAAYFKARVSDSEQLALDGKALRGTIEAGQTRGQHLLALFATDTGVVVGQMAVDEKANEIVVAPELLKTVNLKGRLISGDAMFAQQTLSQQNCLALSLLARLCNSPARRERVYSWIGLVLSYEPQCIRPNGWLRRRAASGSVNLSNIARSGCAFITTSSVPHSPFLTLLLLCLICVSMAQPYSCH